MGGSYSFGGNSGAVGGGGGSGIGGARSDGFIYLFAGMGGYRNTEEMFVATSSDGMTWNVANEGRSVYTPPTGGFRDGSPYYEASTGWYYVAYTAGNVGTSGYFGIARSRTPGTNGSWEFVKHVSDPSGTPVDSGFSWGPSFYEDPDGIVHVFVACAVTGESAPGELILYETHPVVPGDFSGAWSDFAEITMHGQQYGWNEVKVFRSEWDQAEYMMAHDFVGSNVRILTPTVPGVYTAWTLLATIYGEGVAREGPFVIERPNGKGWWVYSEYATDTDVYKRNAYSAAWTLEDGSLIPITEFPGAEYPNGPGLANGEVLKLPRNILADVGNPTSLGGLAIQEPGNFSLESGSIELVNGNTRFTGQVRVGSDSGLDSGGVRFDDYLNALGFFIGMFTGGPEAAMVMHSSGFSYYQIGFAKVAQLTYAGAWQGAGLKIGGANGASGILISGLRHGTANLASGTVTVTDSTTTTNSEIFVTRKTDGGTVGSSYSVTRIAGASFTITSKETGATQVLDTSTVSWLKIEP